MSKEKEKLTDELTKLDKRLDEGSKFLDSLEQHCSENKESCIKMIAGLAAAYSLKHQDEEIMYAIFQPVFEKLGIKVGILPSSSLHSKSCE